MSSQHDAGHGAPHGSDKAAAFTGLIVTSIALFIICFTVIKLTNAKFASHGEGEAKVEATK